LIASAGCLFRPKTRFLPVFSENGGVFNPEAVETGASDDLQLDCALFRRPFHAGEVSATVSVRPDITTIYQLQACVCLRPDLTLRSLRAATAAAAKEKL
jgi:hypothetical protein